MLHPSENSFTLRQAKDITLLSYVQIEFIVFYLIPFVNLAEPFSVLGGM